jgi:predicted alpha-1,2-mannosidase
MQNFERPLVLIVLLVLIGGLGCESERSAESASPVDLVDPMMGTSGSRWMLYPGPSMPFGMVKLSPDNQRQVWKAGYEYTIESIAGFSHLHSWTMGGLLTMPTTGPLHVQPGAPDHPPIGYQSGYRSRFVHERETAEPGYYSVHLYDYDVDVELTTTTRTGWHRYRFPTVDKKARILLDLEFPTEYGFEVLDAEVRRTGPTELVGIVRQQSTDYNDYTLHFVAQVSEPFDSLHAWRGNEVTRNVEELTGSGDLGLVLDYGRAEGESVVLRTGISLVSVDQARLNLERETEEFGWDFDAVRGHASSEWNDLLSTIEVEGGSEVDRKKFYTNMYRSYTARTVCSDVNRRFVAPCEEVAQAPEGGAVYGADAFWNTFWNLNQLWTLATPEIANRWVQSLIAIYDRGGWLPKGPTGIEYSSIMVASHEIPLMVSAYQKGIRDYDVEKAYEAMVHNQTEPGRPHECGGHVGNRNLASYLEHGYVPHEDGPVSNTLEYAYDDWTVAQMARALGRLDDYERFAERAQFYRNIYDSTTGFMRMKHRDGSCFPVESCVSPLKREKGIVESASKRDV